MSSMRRRLVTQRKPSIPAENGIYVVTTGYRFFKGAEWSGGEDGVLGVAVITDECRFFIDPYDYLEGSALRDSDSGKSEKAQAGGMLFTNDKAVAESDFGGQRNTSAGIAAFGTGKGLGWVYNRILRDGRHGYLGAAGEWMAVSRNIEEIQECLSAVGGVPISFSYAAFTSTQIDANSCWVLNKNGELISSNVGFGRYSRAFGSLGF